MAKQINKRELKFTWLSNAHYVCSGYATETRDILTRLLKDGWTFAEIANHGVESYPTTIDGIKIYPRMADMYGSDALVNHSVDFGAHVAFAMLDIWTLQPQALQELQNKNIHFIPYVPIDQEPIPPGVLNNLKFAYKILTFSSFGQKALEKEGFASTLIPEGIDTNIFKPMDKKEARFALKIPENAFVFGMIGANKENPPRKGYQEALEAFSLFAKNHEEAYLFVHTQQINPGGGFPIVEYARQLGVANRVLYYDQYVASFKSDSHAIAREINAFDVQLHPSQTEGFGLLIVEAQACGTPVIVNNCHSQPELVIDGKTGEICNTGKAWWRNLQGYVYPADVNSLYEKMETLYTKLKNPTKAKQIAKDSRNHILQNYSIDTIVKEQWIPFLERLQNEIIK